MKLLGIKKKIFLHAFNFSLRKTQKTVGRDVWTLPDVARRRGSQWSCSKQNARGARYPKKDKVKNMLNYHSIPRSLTRRRHHVKILIVTIKVQKFGPHSVAPEITEDPRKQKSHRIWRIFQCKRFQSAAFMCEEKVIQLNEYRALVGILRLGC